MEQIAGFLNGSEQPPAAAPPPEPSLVTLVSRRDDTPEAAGIFRLFGGPSEPAPAPIRRGHRADNPPPAELDKPAKSAKPANGAAMRARRPPSPTTDGRSPRP